MNFLLFIFLLWFSFLLFVVANRYRRYSLLVPAFVLCLSTSFLPWIATIDFVEVATTDSNAPTMADYNYTIFNSFVQVKSITESSFRLVYVVCYLDLTTKIVLSAIFMLLAIVTLLTILQVASEAFVEVGERQDEVLMYGR